MTIVVVLLSRGKLRSSSRGFWERRSTRFAGITFLPSPLPLAHLHANHFLHARYQSKGHSPARGLRCIDEIVRRNIQRPDRPSKLQGKHRSFKLSARALLRRGKDGFACREVSFGPIMGCLKILAIQAAYDECCDSGPLGSLQDANPRTLCDFL